MLQKLFISPSAASLFGRKLLSTAGKECEAAALFDYTYTLPEIPDQLLIFDLTVDG